MGTSKSASAPRSGSMGPFWAVVAVAVVLLAVYLVRSGLIRGGGTPPGASAPADRVQAPDLGVKEASDPSRTLFLRSLRGKVVVLHFWATWCPPCRAEFPEFAKFAAASVPGGDWVVVPVSIDDTAEPVGPYVQKLAERFPVYWDPGGELANAMAVSAVPTTVILDRAGKVAWQAAGVADWSPSGVPAVVKSLSHE
jgi:thiol-disulfide isomerase/thioredoxin